MDIRSKQKLVIAGIVFIVGIAALLLFSFLNSRPPATQYSDKTVIIDNYASYTDHISPDSFGYLGNYLYEFIKDPQQGIYHATIVNNSYSYSLESQSSKFTVQLVSSDLSWKVSIHTTRNGGINGDISVICEPSNSSCLSLSEVRNPKTTLQSMLPLNTADYIIAYQKDNRDILSIIYYDNNNIGKTKALEKIKSLGFKPEDYTIKYFYGGR